MLQHLDIKVSSHSLKIENVFEMWKMSEYDNIGS